MNDGAYFGASSVSTVRPRETTNVPIARSKKATKLNMSSAHRFGTEYPISAAMSGWRGSETHEQGHALNARDYTPTETMKKGTFGVTPSHSAVGQ